MKVQQQAVSEHLVGPRERCGSTGPCGTTVLSSVKALHFCTLVWRALQGEVWLAVSL